MTVISQTDSGVVLVTSLHCDDCHFTPRQWCCAIDASPLWWLSFHTQTDCGVVLVTGLYCDDCHFTPRQTVVWCYWRVSTVMTFINTKTVVWCYWRVSTVMTVISHPDSGVVLVTGLHCDDCHFTPRQWCGASDGSPLWWLSFHTQTVVWC